MAGTLKSERKTTFVERCLAGKAVASDIDDFVEKWHGGENSGSLRESLGFTVKEYALWVERPQSLNIIIFARMRGLDLPDALELCSKPAVAARAASTVEAKEIISWLKKTRRLK